MPENPRQVEGYGAVKPISSSLYLTQSVVPSLGDIQKSQGKQFMYKAMAEMFGSGMKVAKESYLFLERSEQTPPDPNAIKAAYADKRNNEINEQEKGSAEHRESLEKWLNIDADKLRRLEELSRLMRDSQ